LKANYAQNSKINIPTAFVDTVFHSAKLAKSNFHLSTIFCGAEIGAYLSDYLSIRFSVKFETARPPKDWRW